MRVDPQGIELALDEAVQAISPGQSLVVLMATWSLAAASSNVACVPLPTACRAKTAYSGRLTGAWPGLLREFRDLVG